MGCNASIQGCINCCPVCYAQCYWRGRGVPTWVWILGGPGSGRMTQSKFIAQEYNYLHVSSGEALTRDCVRRGGINNKNARQIMEIMAHGDLVANSTVFYIMMRDLHREHRTTPRRIFGFLFDGYPRTIKQAKYFKKRLYKPDLIIYLQCDEGILRARLRKRATALGDPVREFADVDDVIEKRLDSYREDFLPMIEFLGRKVVTIDGNRERNLVRDDVKTVFDRFAKRHGQVKKTDTNEHFFVEEDPGY